MGEGSLMTAAPAIVYDRMFRLDGRTAFVSGAAGHLKVLFGSTAATLVHILDDSHLTAVVPAGTGAVDVRIQ